MRNLITTPLLPFLVMVLISMILIACTGSSETVSTQETTPATTEPSRPTATAEVEETPDERATGSRYGFVTDVGGIDDNGFNQLIWQGMERAAEELDVRVEYLESETEADYADHINEFVGEGYDGVVTVGISMAEATEATAAIFTDVPFVVVDVPSRTKNVLGLQFKVDQAAFLAGYLAAGMSQAGIVCTYGGLRVEPVTQYMVGFEQGVLYYNAQNNSAVRLLGWKTFPPAEGGGDGVFTNDFENTETGRRFAENFFEEGCDIIFPVAGQTGLGSAAAAQERDLAVIGVEIDQAELTPELDDVYLTSVLKQMDVAVFEAIEQIEAGSFPDEAGYTGTLANEGVGLAPFHAYEGAVPESLSSDLDAVRQGIINGEIGTGWPVPTVTPTPQSTPTGDAEADGEDAQ